MIVRSASRGAVRRRGAGHRVRGARV